MTLDANSTVWNLTSWGRPFQLVSSSLGCSSPETTPVQVECGWGFCSVLTKSGDVYAWWPYGDQYWDGMEELDKDESTKAIIPNDGTVIPCHTWEINEDPTMLPKLPDLPDLPGTGLAEEEREKETKLIKIVASYKSLVGLTNKGHVLKSGRLTDKGSIQDWRYVSKSIQTITYLCSNHDTQLPNYSEIDKVKEHPAFRTITGDDGQERPPEVEMPSDSMLITHVSYIASEFWIPYLRSFNV